MEPWTEAYDRVDDGGRTLATEFPSLRAQHAPVNDMDEVLNELVELVGAQLRKCIFGAGTLPLCFVVVASLFQR